MSYTIKAYKKGSSLKIPIEEKHKYYNNQVVISTKLRIYQQVTSDVDFKIIHNTSDFTIGTGVGEDTMIGRKIQIKDITYTMIFNLVGNVFTDYIPHSDSFDLWLNCRILCVKFDQPKTEANLAAWFENNFIYYKLTGGTTGSPVLSTWQARLRESTNDTGRFTILKDIKFRLSKKDSVKQITFSLSPQKDCTISSNDSTIVNDDMKFIYTFLIGPICYQFDTDARTTEMTSAATWDSHSSNQWIVANSNIKYTLYDLN